MARDKSGKGQASAQTNADNAQEPGTSAPAAKTRTKRGSHRKSHSRRFIWIRRSLIALGLVVVLIVGGVVADYYYLGSLVHKRTVHHIQKVKPGANENILLVGSTTRCGLKVQSVAYGLCSQGVTGVNSDIDMIIHLDPATGAVSLLSIPRDLFIPNARATGANKIDAGLYEGPGQLVAAIEEDFAIPINHYVELNFDTFASVVNALGGVQMYFPVPIFDAYSGLNIERRGCYLLNGVRALQVVRARHLQIQPDPSNHDPRSWPQEGLSDLARIRRTHEFLRVLAAKIASRGLGNPLVDQGLATAVLPDLTVDSGFSEGEMVSLARTFAHTQIANVPQLLYPTVEVEVGSYPYQGYDYGDVEFPIEPTGQNVVHQIFGVASTDNSFTGKPLPTPSSLAISVQDGTGVASQAALIATQLRVKGFNVTSTGTDTPVGAVAETVVWYGGAPPPANGDWTSPAQAAAEAVQAQLQGPTILGYDPSMVTKGDVVTVQTGTDLSIKAVVTAPTTTTTSKAKSTATTSKAKSTSTTTSTTSTTTTTTVYDPPGVSTDSDFSVPSAVNQALEPYDPRACNAAGTGPASLSTTTTTTKK
jgi:LCP family protein required for cell wall assembly